MRRVALRFGVVDSGEFALFRSGIRWLRPDGYLCRAREAVAFCNIGMFARNAPFATESFDFQVALAPCRAGRIRHAGGTALGGYLDRLARLPWSADTDWGYLEDCDDGPCLNEDETVLRFYAGRRVTDVAEDHSGFLSGWHDRVRAWTGEGAGATLLGAGTCEQEVLLRGDDGLFGDMFAAATGPMQIVLSQNEPLVPCSAVLAEQLARKPEEIAAIRNDIALGFPGDGPAPTGRDWAFIGALLNGIEQSPLADRFEQIGRSGFWTAGTAEAVCLSLTTELPHCARHKRLGYTITIHGYRLAALAPAVRHWLRHNFEFFTRKLEDVARDYAALAAGPRKLFVINCMSTPSFESIQNYKFLDIDTLHRLSSLRAKELNLMLHDLARSSGVAVIDADAIAADLGMLAHFPDDFHATGTLIGEMRGELLHQLAAHGIPGFAPNTMSKSADQEFRC
jgi:hypothetical protein